MTVQSAAESGGGPPRPPPFISPAARIFFFLLRRARAVRKKAKGAATTRFGARRKRSRPIPEVRRVTPTGKMFEMFRAHNLSFLVAKQGSKAKIALPAPRSPAQHHAR